VLFFYFVVATEKLNPVAETSSGSVPDKKKSEMSYGARKYFEA
jgi:hypothetical protein